MTICREWLLHREGPYQAQAKLLTCNSWQCDYCQPNRKRKLLAQSASGNPNRFLTLTINPSEYESPEARCLKLAWAWRTIVKRLRREHPSEPIEYMAVVEATKLGEPHLHILIRGPYIPQHVLSAYMRELVNSPIVDIRKVRKVSDVIRYVAKYITKKPEQFGTCKRYWQSRAYQLDREADIETVISVNGKYAIWRDGLHALLELWKYQGYNVAIQEENSIIAIHPAFYHFSDEELQLIVEDTT